jgi:hypothetical protein
LICVEHFLFFLSVPYNLLVLLSKKWDKLPDTKQDLEDKQERHNGKCARKS